MYGKIINPKTGNKVMVHSRANELLYKVVEDDVFDSKEPPSWGIGQWNEFYTYSAPPTDDAANLPNGGDIVDGPPPLPHLRHLAYAAAASWNSEQTRVGAASNFATLVRDNKIVCSDIVSLQSWITENSNGKHILIADMHGHRVHPFFLNLTLDALIASHKNLIFEALIHDDITSPRKRIREFFAGKNALDYISAYEHAISNGIIVEPGDYDWAQPKHNPVYENYRKARYKVNNDIATNKIRNQLDPVIAFYGAEHTVSRRSLAAHAGALGIPDYLVPGTFFVYRPIFYPYVGFDSKLKKLVENATDGLMGKKIVIVPCKLNIDWGHYFILIPKELAPHPTR